MTPASTEKLPRYSSTSRKLQLLNRKANQSHPHSKATNGIAQRCFTRALSSCHRSGRFLRSYLSIPILSQDRIENPALRANMAHHPMRHSSHEYLDLRVKISTSHIFFVGFKIAR